MSIDHAKVRELFAAARERPAEQRVGYLASACPDAELRSEVLSLLRHDATGDELPVRAPVLQAPAQPQKIGGYRILEELGAGGMGVVYLAEQEHPKRTVALKVVRSGLASPRALRRFEFESLVLGQLHHPGIAQVFEAGTATTADGPLPFFAMEHVEGRPLTSFAAERRLALRDKLALLAAVCDAVHHAHQKGVLHRDLKPGNILVDAHGQPKVLDFGVARALDADLQATRLTAERQLVGTLSYMSPEQARLDPSLDTRSDVYALGVVGYELLAGRLPYAIEDASVLEALRVICEVEPVPLGALARDLRGDVETIFGKALAKDRAQRYGSASELADDVRRYLRSEPIAARPPSTIYQLRKLVRRRPALATACVLGALLLVSAAVGGVLYAMSTGRALRAEQAASRKSAFLARTIFAADPRQVGGAVSITDLLRRAAADVDATFQDDAATRAELHEQIGAAMTANGLFDDARTEHERALALREATFGREHRDTASSLGNLAWLDAARGDWAGARDRYRDVLATLARVAGPEDHKVLSLRNDLSQALVALREFDEAEAMITENVETARRVLGERHETTLLARQKAALLLLFRGEWAEAERAYADLVAATTEAFGPEHPDTLDARKGLAEAVEGAGRIAEAERMMTELIAVQRRVIGDGHLQTVFTAERLANLLASHDNAAAEPWFEFVVEQRKRLERPGETRASDAMVDLVTCRLLLGKREAADAAARECLELLRGTPLEDAWQGLCVRTVIGTAMLARGDLDDALAVTRPVLAAATALAPPHLNVAVLLRNFGKDLGTIGRHAESEAFLRAAVPMYVALSGPDAPRTLLAQNSVAEALVALGRVGEAEPIVREVLAARERTLGQDHAETLESLCTLSALLWTRDEGSDADDAVALLRRVVEARSRALGRDDPKTLQTLNNLAVKLAQMGRQAEAEPVMREAAEGYARRLGPESSETLNTRSNLANLQMQLGDTAAAIAALNEILPVQVRVVGEEHTMTLGTVFNLGLALNAQGAHQDAEAAWRRAVRIADRLTPNHWTAARMHDELAHCLLRQVRGAEAVAEMHASVATMRRAVGDEHPRMRVAVEKLADVYDAVGEPENAAATRATLTR